MTKGDVIALVFWVLSIIAFASAIAVAIAFRPENYWEPAFRAVVALMISGVMLFALPFLIDDIRSHL